MNKSKINKNTNKEITPEPGLELHNNRILHEFFLLL